MKNRIILPYHFATRRSILLLGIFFLFGNCVYSQEVIRGTVEDSVQNKSCHFATVSLLLRDSTLVTFTRTRLDGSFYLFNIPPGKFIIKITHPEYYDFYYDLKGYINQDLNIGRIVLIPLAKSLPPVIVFSGKTGVLMRGDTVEYSTSNIKLRSNATVEELLTRLPGVQVDQQGNITVNGQKIQRLLVDGEDVFGTDPTIVTKNFNADLISKVQVIDKKSAHSEFTGVDDGERTKTLNLTIKNEVKRGYFLNAEVGADPESYYYANSLLGSFKDKRQFVGLGILSNTGALGFNQEANGSESGLALNSSGNDPLGATAGVGIPRIELGGAHYSNRWNRIDGHLDGDVQYGQLSTQPISNSTSEQNLPNSLYSQNQLNKSINTQFQQQANVHYESSFDSTSKIRISFSGNTMTGNNNLSSSLTSYLNDTLVNQSMNNLLSQVKSSDYHENFMWRLASKHTKKRVFSMELSVESQNNHTNGYVRSITNFYAGPGNVLTTDTVDQRKIISTTGSIINSALNFVQPVFKGVDLAMSYSLGSNTQGSSYNTYARGNGKYNLYIDSLSNNFTTDVITQAGVVNFQVSKRRLYLTFGADFSNYNYEQRVIGDDSSFTKKYDNLFPDLNGRYTLNAFSSISFSYNGTSQLPSINQLQPVNNNNNPLHITIGNPDLHPSSGQNFRIEFNEITPLFLFVGFTSTITSQEITMKTYTDSMGRQVSQFVNSNGAYTLNLTSSISKSLEPIHLRIGSVVNLAYGQNTNFVNNLLSNNETYNASFGLNSAKYVTNKYSFSLSSTVAYTGLKSSVNSNSNTFYWTQIYEVAFSTFLQPNLELKSNCTYSWRQRISPFDQDLSSAVWNASICKMWLDNRLSWKLKINDILNENKGFSRSIIANQITENNFNKTGRYWMLSIAYRFEKR
jgi:outer membrane beta-barrel protein